MKTTIQNLQSIYNRALQHIESQQKPDGSFADDSGQASVFYTGLIVGCLKECADPISTGIKDKAATFLLHSRNLDWTWSYSGEYPPDLDDTFVSLRALHISNPETINEKVLASMVTILVRQEEQPGGPYQTWITSDKNPVWNDIDIVVNSNIATFCNEIDIHLKPLEHYFDEGISQHRFTSRYYDEEIVVLYFLSLHYRGAHRQDIVDLIVQKRNTEGHWGNSLHTACAITALLQLGQDPTTVESAVAYLIDTGTDGMWPNAHLFIERITGNDISYSTCSAYVSACCLQACMLFEQAIVPEEDTTSINPTDTAQQKYIEEVHMQCRSYGTDPAILKQLNDSLATLQQKDPTGGIPLLPYYFAQVLHASPHISHDTVRSLATANVLGWIGYTIYDKLLDGETLVSQLPLGNHCVRQVHRIFGEIIPTHTDTVERILAGIDNATLWEYNNCTVGSTPDYGNHHRLAEKSLGHALGPIVLCLLCNEPEQAVYIETFFRHYLIARQLHDDAHDWLEDLGNGFLNSVSARMVSKVSSIADMAVLQKLFWEEIIDAVCGDIMHHVSEARTILKRSPS